MNLIGYTFLIKTKKTTKKKSTTSKKDLEAKIADLEAKLNKLAAAQEAKPAEAAPKPAETKPAETAKPKPAETAPEPKPAETAKPKPAETAPKPAEKAPPASVPLHERFREIPTGNWNTQKVAITGFTAPGNRYFGSRALAAQVEVTPSNWNDHKTKITGFTAPGNKYFATKQRLAYHPEAKKFGTWINDAPAAGQAKTLHLHLHHNLNLRQVLKVHLVENQNKLNLKTMRKNTWHV
jgi:outer membrane biosynthesis protein TonB